MTDIVRVGDRFAHNDHRITVTAVHRDPYLVEYTIIDVGSKISWSSRTSMIPAAWVKTGSEPVPPTTCVACNTADAEIGQLYCWDCAVTHAGEWAGLSDVDATAKMVSLIEKTEK